jgi:NADH-quinone oxidoreductase subunit A
MSGFNIMDYAPLLVMFIVAIGFSASQVLVTQLVGPRKRTATKLMPYECGKDPVGSARDRFSIKFYNVAVVFLIFDIEVLFMIPFAVAFKELFRVNVSYGTIAFIEIMVFIATLVIGLIYAWKKGTFDWNVQARAEAKEEAKALKARKLQRVEELKRGDIKVAA